MKRVMVTGGMGYIGSHTIIEILKRRNWEVYSIDNFTNSKPVTLKRLQKITGKKIKNFNLDLCDLSKLRRTFQILKPIHGLIHFAALKSVEESVEYPLLYYRNNINSLINLLECCKEFSVRHFIYSSSCSIYGDIPLDRQPVDEDTPLGSPNSPYAHSKLIGEEIIKQYYSRPIKGMKAISLRYFNPAGADSSGLIGEDPGKIARNLLNVITRAAMEKKSITVFGKDYPTRDGTCIRDYIHVSDIAQSHLDALRYSENKKNPSSYYEVFNLGTGKGVTVLEMIHAFEKITGITLNKKFAPRRAGDVVAIYSNSRRAEEYLKWKPRQGIGEMTSSAWQWELNRNQ